jgi:phospholipid N-methyltransferase
MNALGLATADPFDGERAGAVISVLPLSFLPVEEILGVLDAAFGHLREGGAFYQVTCGPRCPVAGTLLDRLSLEADRVGAVEADEVPFTLYRITRRTPMVSR